MMLAPGRPGAKGSSGSTPKMGLPQIMLLTAAGMVAVMTYGFLKLPNSGNGMLESQLAELHADLIKQNEQFHQVENKLNQLAAEEHRTAEAVRRLEHNGGGSGDGGAPPTARRFGLERDGAKPSAPDSAPGWKDKEDVPDLTAYVKKMSIFDPDGCSSGQRFNKETRKCEWQSKLERRPTVTPEEFEYYFNVGRAVILTNFTDDWKAFENWRPEALKRNYGRETVNIQKGRSKRKDFETAQHLLRRDMNFGDFLDQVMENKVENDLYLTANNNLLHRKEMRGILNDMDPFYPGFLWVDPTQTHFWYGAGGTKTPLHFDPISLFHTHILGKKLWRLWPPEMAPYLYHREKVYSDVDSYNPDHKKFPLFKHAKVIEEVILPGETLFVPTGWWHTVDILETPTSSVSATSWLSKFMRFESRLRSKWPQKAAQPAGGGPRGPALPGEQTPKDFKIHDWYRNIAVKHQKMADADGKLPMEKLKWQDVIDAKDSEAIRQIVDGWSTDKDERAECYVYFLLNPQCSEMSFDWKAWLIENLGLQNSVHSLLNVMGRDGDDVTMKGIQASTRKCVQRGAAIFDTPAVDATADDHEGLMRRIHENQAKLGKKVGVRG